MPERDQNEGEGSRTAAKQYDERTKRFVETGTVEAKAKEAAAALDSAESEALRKAEEEGKSHSHGEDPQVHREK